MRDLRVRMSYLKFATGLLALGLIAAILVFNRLG